MDALITRIRRLVPAATVTCANNGVRVEQDGHVCWMDPAEVKDLDDVDLGYLVYSLLHGLVK